MSTTAHLVGNGPVRIPPRYRPEHRLPQGLRADGDVAADIVRVVRLQVGGQHRPGQDEVAEPGPRPLPVLIGDPTDARVHGRCGELTALTALTDVFGIRNAPDISPARLAAPARLS